MNSRSFLFDLFSSSSDLRRCPRMSLCCRNKVS
jgi:hypothetical protein